MTANHAEKILEVRGLTKTYGGEAKKGAKQPTPTLDVLKGIDIDIYRGDVVCLIGPSGCGKSTFLRCLNRLEIPTGGSIKFEGIEVDDAHIDAVRTNPQEVIQNTRNFVKHHADILGANRHLNTRQLLNRDAISMLTAHHGHIVQTIHIRQCLNISFLLSQFFGCTVQQPNMWICALNNLTI